jgi:glycosyltransferase involved in cell wall biosynthesis
MTDHAAFDPLSEELRKNPMPCRISACMLAKDAAATIASSLQSLRFCDQIIVVVDSSTTDNTEAIARSLAHHVEVRHWTGFSDAWKHVLSGGEGEWLFMIAADEVVTSTLAQSIIEATTRDADSQDGFLMRRHTRFLGRFLTHGDWGRDYVLRVVRRSKYQFNDALIHESLRNPGRTSILEGLLLHEGERTIDEHIARQNRYTTLSAQQMFEKGRKVSLLGIALKPPFRFLRSYILRLGFLDGWPGFVQAWYSAVYVFTRYAKLRELRRRSQST